MRILCLIAFVFLATSFTTNNEKFEKTSNSESLETKKPTEVFRVNAYQKDYISNGWKKIPIKISVTNSYAGENITVVEVYSDLMNQWQTVSSYSYMVQKTSQYIDGDAASQFDYKAGNLYFSF